MEQSSQCIDFQYTDFINNIDEYLSDISDDIVFNFPVIKDFQNDISRFQSLMSDTLGKIAKRQSNPIVKNLINGYLQSIDDLDEALLDNIDDQMKEARIYNRLSKLVNMLDESTDFSMIRRAQKH